MQLKIENGSVELSGKEILRQINSNDKSLLFVDNNIYKLNEPKVLFQRIDKDKFEI